MVVCSLPEVVRLVVKGVMLKGCSCIIVLVGLRCLGEQGLSIQGSPFRVYMLVEGIAVQSRAASREVTVVVHTAGSRDGAIPSPLKALRSLVNKYYVIS